MPELSNISSDDRELDQLLKEADRRQAKKNRIFFVRQFLHTFDPRPDAYPHDIDFDPYGFQEELIEQIYDAITVGYDLFIEKSRDMGVSWVVLGVLFWCWLFEPGFQALIGSRKESYVDNREIDSLFGKLEFFIRTIKDDELIPEGFKMDVNRQYMKLTNPENNNAILGESSNPNFSRSGRYKVVFFDEFGFWPDAKSSWAAAGDATRCRIAVTTPPDVPSYAKSIRFGDKIKVITLHWTKHPHKTQEWYEGEKARRTEDEVLHELDISWEYSAAGRPYPEVDKVPFVNCDYNPALPLYVSIDLGLDAVALQWWQPVQNSDWFTLIGAYEKSEKIIDWFYPFFGLPIESAGVHTYSDEDLSMIERVRYWRKPSVFGDPSGKQRHIESAESAYAKLITKGIYVQSNDRENEWIPRRDAVKRLLPRVQVHDTPGTRYWHECMKLARFPTRKEESQAVTAITKPVHDWTSHHRTSTEFFAVNYKNFPLFEEDVRNNQRAVKPIYDATGRLIT
jgi:hypothetical protein